jgi:DNA mismatch repair protein MutS
MKIVNLYKEYFEQFSSKYDSNKLAILMQVGDFYELYGVESDNLNFGNVTQIASILEIVRSRKNKDCEFISIESPLFTGFPKHSAQKHIKKLLDFDYYVILIDQFEEKNIIQRKVSKILTKGTFIDDLTIQHSTTMCCIYYDNFNGIGVAFLDLTIGICKAYDIENDYGELTRLLEAENPCQTITIKQDSIKQNLLKPPFQETILKSFFPKTGFLSAIEYTDLDTKHNARVALICLLEEAKYQDCDIVKKLDKPITNNSNSSILKLEDTALYQLGIVSQNTESCSLFNTINKTYTPSGKRFLKKNLLEPLTCPKILNERYTLLNEFRSCSITSELKSLVDIEKYVHKWRLGKISPHEFVIMIYCFPTITKIISNVHENTSFTFDQLETFTEFNNEINSIFDIQSLEKYNSLNNIESNIFNKNIKPDLDNLQNVLNTLLEKIQDMLEKLNQKDPLEKKSAIVKFEKTANNDQWYFTTTTKKVEALKKSKILDNQFSLKNQKSNVRLFHPEIENIRSSYVETLKEMIELVKKEFILTLDFLESKYCIVMKKIVEFITYADFYNCGALLINHYGYSKPNIIKKESSYISCTSLRHAIIERLDQNINYVPNDVNLPEHGNPGMLLFGLNGGGKSSYMKSVGLCIVLAQIGFWVPCENLQYYPFTKLFTRISGDDNVMKGLSSFAVEMKELRAILHKADCNSLVLGDEICKGTEQESALGIVASSLITLTKRNKAKFIFATHLHALSKIEKIINMVNIYHISVECKNDKIIYNRKLNTGSGPSLYGLEVAKHLLHDKEVLQLAEEIRSNFSLKASTYNKKVIIDKCAICHTKENLDVHHIEFQCQANKYNLVSHGKHKNSNANLVVLCKNHHNQVHNNNITVNGWQESSEGNILKWKQNNPYTLEEIKIIKSYKNYKLPKNMLILKLKNEHNINIDLATFKFYTKV